jgi:hypothetical protein
MKGSRSAASSGTKRAVPRSHPVGLSTGSMRLRQTISIGPDSGPLVACVLLCGLALIDALSPTPATSSTGTAGEPGAAG